MPIATNPDTGETLFLGSDGWQPAKIAVNPETKERLAFDGSTWIPLKTPEPSVGADMAKSGGIGLAKGVIGLAGLPGDIGGAISSGAEKLGIPENIRSNIGRAVRATPFSAFAGPGSQDIQKIVEGITGEFYKPKTRAGEYAQTFGEFVPAVAAGPVRTGAKVIPEVARRLVTQAAIPSASSETAGQITKQVAPELEPYARFIAGMGGGVAASKLEGMATRPGAVRSVPSQEALADAAEQSYTTARSLPFAMVPQSPAQVANNIRTDLNASGFRDLIAPKTYGLIESLKDPLKAGKQTANISDVLSVRTALNKVGITDPVEKAASAIAIDAIDTYIANLAKPRAAIAGPGDQLAQELSTARGNYAASKRSQQITDALEKAQNQALSTGVGANIDNATRQQFKQIINNPKKARGYSPDEIDAMKRVVRGTTAGNVARGVGKLAPTGVVSGALSPLIGGGLGSLFGPAGTVAGMVMAPVLGMVGRQIGNVSTAKQAAYADALVRSRSPLAAPTRDPAELAAILANRSPWLRQSIINALMIRPQLYGVDQSR